MRIYQTRTLKLKPNTRSKIFRNTHTDTRRLLKGPELATFWVSTILASTFPAKVSVEERAFTNEFFTRHVFLVHKVIGSDMPIISCYKIPSCHLHLREGLTVLLCNLHL